MIHYLKTLPEDFEATTSGNKLFEVRRYDSYYLPGAYLMLREFDPEKSMFTGRKIILKITYVLKGGNQGIAPDHVVLGCKVPDIHEINAICQPTKSDQFDIGYPPNED